MARHHAVRQPILRSFELRAITTRDQLSHELKKQALQEGFNPVGIARIPGSHRLNLRTAALQRWLQAGHQADMNWMAATRRQNTELLLEGVSSLLAVGMNYYVDVERRPHSLSVARFGWGRDYHRVIKKRLNRLGRWLEEQRPDCRWKVCVDADPLMDKAWAEEAGLGWIGKHSNLIHHKRGSWMVLGHLLCTEPLTPDQPSQPRCGSCQACIDACPTQAISEPFVVNSRQCLAYHTIENRQPKLPESIQASIGDWIAGCDICQDVCPWNQSELPSSSDPDVQPKAWILKLTRDQALNWDDETWNKNLRGSALRRIKPWMWRRNALAAQAKKTLSLSRT